MINIKNSHFSFSFFFLFSLRIKKAKIMFKKMKFPHTYVIIFSIIVLCAILTWIVPGGTFERETVNVNGIDRSVIIPGSFKNIDNEPQTWQVLSALYNGFIRASEIIIFILIIGGAFWILNLSKAIDVGIYSFLGASKNLERYRIFKFLGVNNIIIVLIMLMFSFFGAVFGMSEETIAFVIIFVPMAISMGYDSIVGVCMCFIAAGIGFAGCLFNPFTLGIAQGIAKLDLYSGIEYRFLIWVVMNIVGISFVLWYANKIKKNPQKSIMYELDDHWRKKGTTNIDNIEQKSSNSTWFMFFAILTGFIVVSVIEPMTVLELASKKLSIPMLPIFAGLFALTGFITLRKSMQFFVLNLLMFTILLLIYGVMKEDKWDIMKIATLFMGMGISAAIAMGSAANTIAKEFLNGAKDIMSAALVVGLAAGIIVILNDGKITDTILNSMSTSLNNFGEIGSLSAMYGIVSIFNMIITSGTAKASLLMPILSEFSDLIHISRQATVTAFHIGDGITNLITPTSGVLIGVLEIARIPFQKWVKWALPYIIIMVILGFLLLIPTVTMDLNGF